MKVCQAGAVDPAELGTAVALPDPALVVLAIAARLGDGCNLASDLSTLDRKLAVLRQHCLQAGRDPAQVEVTVLDIPVIGRDREDASSIVEKLRGRTTAATFAQRHHAGTAGEHIGRYRLLADRGVKTVFVSAQGEFASRGNARCLAESASIRARLRWQGTHRRRVSGDYRESYRNRE
jgi:alkanesulfonate monooxygenase SsuD/methylene tetrahydromethanopterin reductase-like flavin-dependent oxidoreductase (luciferase family)